MPNILKRQGAFHTDGTVCIPDVDLSPPVPEAENPDENETQQQPEEECRSKPEEQEETALPAPAYTPAVMSREELTVYYQKELDEIRCEAEQRAYTDALRQKRSELNQAIERVDAQLAAMQEMQTQYMKQYAKELKFLAVDIAEKMIAEKIAEDDMALSKLVMQMVTSVKNASWINVEVSEQLVSLVEAIRKELEKPEYHGRAYVTPTASARDTCRVTTEDGTVVATISAQAQNLRNAFHAMEQE